ncbi:hypothetical protein [Comamonas badia]|uniref:hypothetical protein n=1 Tax=Comamonas badia TaxID=265291 RepID=UPI0003F895AD|nr:hypothetical protein [Comamonas badia]
MQNGIQQTPAPKLVSPAKIAAHEKYPPLGVVTSPTVTTEAAAHYLNRRPQTLRGWACAETFPAGLHPIRINGRLGWPVAGLRAVLGVQ